MRCRGVIMGLGVLALRGGAAGGQEPAGPPVGQPGLRIVSGQSAVVGGNAAGARERALDEALRQAVSQALTEMLDPETRAAQARGLKALEARARSYVRGYRTLEEGEANGSYGVRLEAEVDELALRRAAERLGAPLPSGTGPPAARPGLLLVANGPPGPSGVGAAATTALSAALTAAGARAQVAEAPDAPAALAAAGRASLSQVAFLTAEEAEEGVVRGTGKLAVSCRVSAHVVATASGLAVAERVAAPRAFADRKETARNDCLSRAAAELAPQLMPSAGSAATAGDLRTVIIDADVVEPAAVAALLKAVRSVGAVSSAELRRVVPGHAEIRVRTRTLAPALAPALSRDGGGVIMLSGVSVSGDLIRLRVRLRQQPPPPPLTPGCHAMKTLLLLAILALGCAHTIPYGAVAFRVESNVPDATVWVDDVLIGKVSDWTQEGRNIRAGFHRIEVRHPGFYSYFQEVDLAEGSGVVVKAELRQLID